MFRIVFALLLLGSAPAHAGGKFTVPEGCTAFATVQMHSCQVSQHYRCAQDAPGDQWAAYSDGQGVYYLSHIDSETRWLESLSLISGARDRLTHEADPASFSTLLMTGRDDYVFETENDQGVVRRYTGFDSLTGEKLVIDGVELERTKFEVTARDESGAVVFRRSGKQLVHRDWRLFFADRETSESADGTRTDLFDTPVTFAFPGQAGFLETAPQFDCEMTMTKATVEAKPWAIR